MKYEAVIGLELHIQLATNSKLFSSSPTQFGASPNTQVNEIDLGYPGVLPKLNTQALNFAILFGSALNAKINKNAFFMRKNYFYPDLPKGYQISQLDDSIIQGGEITLKIKETEKKVRINRGQLEEDAGKSVHDFFVQNTGIDLNRAGVPLIELVSEPDINSAEEAVEYMKTIHHLIRYLGISDGNMQEGSFRCDANVSVREKGTNVLNPRVELKNINSFRFVEQAINLEIERQIQLMEEGKIIEQETRLFDSELMETRVMRSKENANDYRYFPDPDLLPVNLSDDYINQIQNLLPELPDIRKNRYIKILNLDEDSANYLLQTKQLADYFDRVIEQCKDAKLSANIIQGEFARLLNSSNFNIDSSPIKSDMLGELILKIKENIISQNSAKKIMQFLWENPNLSINEIIDKLGLKQVNDNNQLEAWVLEIIKNNPEQVKAYKSGQIKMIGFLTGEVIKLSNKQANPKAVNELLKLKLDN